MSEDRNAFQDDTPENASADEADGGLSRVRFKGIVETGLRATPETRDEDYDMVLIARDERRWTAMSRQVWQACRLVAIFVFCSYLIGPPLGNYLAYTQLYDTAEGWSPFSAFGETTVLSAFVIPALILILGYGLSRMATMLNAAESIAAAAQQFVTPDITAATNADAVGAVVRGHMAALNEGLDGALSRLAGVEALIRQHVEAIELAGAAIEHKATGAVDRVAGERARLMELTESLNAHADSFAAAIAERANSSIEALQSADLRATGAETDFSDRLARLEEAAMRAVESFESLREALREGSDGFEASAVRITETANQTQEETRRAASASEAAAASAAESAAAIGEAARKISEDGRRAADEAIEQATRDAERVAAAAREAAASETEKVRAASEDALSAFSARTGEQIAAARADADKAAQAAADVSKAAAETGEAARRAAADIAAAREAAQRDADAAAGVSDAAAGKIAERGKALAEARAALEKENERLEALIEEQRQRADRLAEAIAAQTERLSRLAEGQLQEQAGAESAASPPSDHEEARDPEVDNRPDVATSHRVTAKPDADERDETAQLTLDPAPLGQPSPQTSREAAPTLDLRPRDAAAEGDGADRLDALARDIAGRGRQSKDDAKASPADPGRAARKASQANGGGKPAGRRKSDVSWREILDAAEDAEPLDLAPASKAASPARDEAADAIRTIARLQDFTVQLETRLYGDPPPALKERYSRGDRNVFANRLLRLNETDVKRRIRSESARDREFEKGVHGFLQGFEKLLEDATTSETADEELEEYLSSPLGRVYLLIGATVGYFA